MISKMVLTAVALLVSLTGHAQEWVAVSPSGVQMEGIVASAAQPDRLYAFSRGGGVFVSDTAGETWIPRNNGLSNTDISSIAASGLNGDRVVAAQVGGRLLRSEDGGGTWQSDGSGAVEFVTAIAVHPGNDSVVYALDDGASSILKSTDGGATWTRTALDAGALNALAVPPGEPDAVYVAAAGGLLKTSDRGNAWTLQTSGSIDSSATEFVAMAVQPESAMVIALTAEGVIFRTNGIFWDRLFSGHPDSDPAARDGTERIAFDPWAAGIEMSRALIGGANGVYASVDAGAPTSLATDFYGGGNTWFPLNDGIVPGSGGSHVVQALLFDPAVERRYFAVVDGSVLRYDGKLAADFRISWRGSEKQRYPGTIFIVPDGTGPNGEHGLRVMFMIRDRSVETATDVRLHMVIDETVTVSGWSLDADSDGCAVDGNEFVCEYAELGSTEGYLLGYSAESGPKTFSLTVSSAEREATPGDNAAAMTRFIGTESDTESEADTDTDTNEPDAGSDTRENAVSDAETDTDADAGSGTAIDSGSSADTNADADASSGSSTPSSPVTPTPGGGGAIGLWFLVFAASLKVLALRRRRSFLKPIASDS